MGLLPPGRNAYVPGMVFWSVAFALAAVTALLIALALLRGRHLVRARAEYDIAVYREQLAGVETDLARGVVSEETADRARTEISRRILDADTAAARDLPGEAPRALTAGVAAFVVVALMGGSIALYRVTGAPGYGDLPLQTRLAASQEMRATRPGQAAAEVEAAAFPSPLPPPDPEFAALVDQLRTAVTGRPDDARGLALLARNEAALGNFAAAHAAQARLIEVLGAEATAEQYSDLADMMILAAGGYVSPEAEAALGKALARDPEDGRALYYTGLMYAQNDRPDRAFAIWRALLEGSGPGAPWVAPIRAQIEDAAARAGIRFALSPEGTAAPRGPTADDIAAAATMSPEDQQAMIRGMVEGLAARLAAEGGNVEDWARLIGALGVLGERDRARAILTEAQVKFDGEAAAIETLEAAARRAGLAP